MDLWSRQHIDSFVVCFDLVDCGSALYALASEFGQGTGFSRPLSYHSICTLFTLPPLVFGDYDLLSWLCRTHWKTLIMVSHPPFPQRWDIVGFLCNHAMGAISCRLLDPYDFVEDWFKTTTYRATYNDYVPLTRGKKHWLAILSTVIPPWPPNMRIQPGRRKVARRESISNGGLKKRCRNCRRWGHNKQSCKNPALARANQPLEFPPRVTTSVGTTQERATHPPSILS
uniref:CCHC-type domain-containing protein n=1 Tax=Ananas comosus var. bracteatus TaxID=296719 RepID=A0A6V7P953_ANACO|nr:unnamed protein product [Ananas comosus var. bracteatus]